MFYKNNPIAPYAAIDAPMIISAAQNDFGASLHHARIITNTIDPIEYAATETMINQNTTFMVDI